MHTRSPGMHTRSGATSTAELLLAAGADPTIRGEYGTTALKHAERKYNEEVAALLRENPLVKAQLSPDQRAAGADPDVRPVAVGETDLRAIASFSRAMLR